eukprot:SAG11_NODE_10399_length_834_cov_1.491156_1_plen_192_part_10
MKPRDSALANSDLLGFGLATARATPRARPSGSETTLSRQRPRSAAPLRAPTPRQQGVNVVVPAVAVAHRGKGQGKGTGAAAAVSSPRRRLFVHWRAVRGLALHQTAHPSARNFAAAASALAKLLSHQRGNVCVVRARVCAPLERQRVWRSAARQGQAKHAMSASKRAAAAKPRLDGSRGNAEAEGAAGEIEG